MSKQKATKKTKRSRNGKGWYLMYRNAERREKSKARRLARHLVRFPDDLTACKALAVLPKAYAKRPEVYDKAVAAAR